MTLSPSFLVCKVWIVPSTLPRCCKGQKYHEGMCLVRVRAPQNPSLQGMRPCISRRGHLPGKKGELRRGRRQVWGLPWAHAGLSLGGSPAPAREGWQKDAPGLQSRSLPCAGERGAATSSAHSPGLALLSQRSQYGHGGLVGNDSGPSPGQICKVETRA